MSEQPTAEPPLRLERFHPDKVLATGADASLEPVLAVDEIQGNILPGFGTQCTVLLGLKIDEAPGAAGAARAWLRKIAPNVASLAQVNTLREVRRAVARATGARPNLPDVLLNVALSFPALAPLGLPSSRISDGPFRGGMASTNLQDPIDAKGVPVGWEVGATKQTTPDIFLILGSDSPDALAAAAALLESELGGAGLRLIYNDRGDALPGSMEHFGFRDDISQPGVRGRLSQRVDHVLTRRYFDPEDFRSQSFAKPGQPLLWPGQFVLGWPTQRSDRPDLPGNEAVPPEPWMRNGSFLVFRRLRQDVAAFRQFAAEHAPQVSAQLGRPVSPEELQAWIVGRWPDGTPLTRSPGGGDRDIADDDMAVNFFGYAGDEPDAAVVEDGTARTVPGVGADNDGFRCPHFAHVRKVNPRDKGSDQGPSFRFRILRRGIPYGPPYEEGEAQGVDRGLLFLAYMRSPDPQFLTLNATWMNTALAPEGDGHDLLVGQDRTGRAATRRTPEGASARIVAPAHNPWVVPTGGGFFFAPARSVLSNL